MARNMLKNKLCIFWRVGNPRRVNSVTFVSLILCMPLGAFVKKKRGNEGLNFISLYMPKWHTHNYITTVFGAWMQLNVLFCPAAKWNHLCWKSNVASGRLLSQKVLICIFSFPVLGPPSHRPGISQNHLQPSLEAGPLHLDFIVQ